MVERVDYPLVCIIIVNWNGWQDTINCLDSLEKVSYPNFEILVVDNGSSDNSVERIKAAFPDVKILELQQNLGYSGGTNQGFRYVLDRGADYILTINNDVIVDPSFLCPMVETMENDAGIGALNPKIFYLNHPEGNVFWAAGGKANLWLAACENRGQNQLDTGQFEQPAEVDFGTGCCLLASREALIKTGLLDAAYFIYYDDTDWSFRLREKGLTINYTPHARIWHAVNASSKIRDTGNGTLSPFVHFLHARNHLWFLRSHTSYPQRLIAFPAYFARRMVFYSGAFIILRRWEKLKELWKGFRAGLKNKPDLEEI